ncbi:glutathione synthetase ATP-binding domain-like protein [Daldinia caldariorum]|uniref:glutathione synthetase ATP-binding domain-like protein n=1 Tax=Daldinia caldariorum TaxID=326644 RepID=UPI002007C9FD|nr:glutathione synthetase ATP-binding domain-like protein [Daldinia caldariorum]KAI1466001.1 glutathione synthetase ATP-binding domain-like protein [Daldinia caldariorum]
MAIYKLAMPSNSFVCRWVSSPVTKCVSDGSTTLQTIDLALSLNLASPNSEPPNLPSGDDIWIQSGNNGIELASAESFGSQEAFRFLVTCLQATKLSNKRLARLIIPLQRGTVVRSDIVPLRLKDAFGVERVVSFLAPLQPLSGDVPRLELISIVELFRSSAGGILLQEPCSGAPIVPPEFEADFENKMSLPWVLPGLRTRKRLVLVGVSYRAPSHGSWTVYACEAARYLGIDLVIIDKPGCWIERSEYSQWYEAFLPVGTWWTNPPDHNMADRIAETVRSYGKPIDGIVTFIDSFQATVSRAAEKLGLPHQPAESYEIATDKYRVGIAEGRNPFYGSTAKEALDFASAQNLSYPLILKPRLGLNSEGIVRVNNAAEIQAGVEMIHKTFFKSFTMEKYCDGPEVDANMILLDGEILFCEICDDFPKPGDQSDITVPASQRSFLETFLVHPSALPSQELEMLQSSISATLRRIGISSGVLHVEARVERSSVEYRSDGGYLDLRPIDKAATSTPPAPWILEINPRPPGSTASRIVESVYGIDYFGVALSLAIQDKDRARALSLPFRNGAQYTGVLVFIGADFEETREGIFDSDDICKELIGRRPDLAKNINRYGCLVKRGQKVPHPSSGANTFIAYFNVFSKSRKEALEIAAEVRKEVRYSFR